jgi:hypothetical protein
MNPSTEQNRLAALESRVAWIEENISAIVLDTITQVFKTMNAHQAEWEKENNDE